MFYKYICKNWKKKNIYKYNHAHTYRAKFILKIEKKNQILKRKSNSHFKNNKTSFLRKQ
jgi:hypothetical protein